LTLIKLKLLIKKLNSNQFIENIQGFNKIEGNRLSTEKFPKRDYAVCTICEKDERQTSILSNYINKRTIQNKF